AGSGLEKAAIHGIGREAFRARRAGGDPRWEGGGGSADLERGGDPIDKPWRAVSIGRRGGGGVGQPRSRVWVTAGAARARRRWGAVPGAARQRRCIHSQSPGWA